MADTRRRAIAELRSQRWFAGDDIRGFAIASAPSRWACAARSSWASL